MLTSCVMCMCDFKGRRTRSARTAEVKGGQPTRTHSRQQLSNASAIGPADTTQEQRLISYRTTNRSHSHLPQAVPSHQTLHKHSTPSPHTLRPYHRPAPHKPLNPAQHTQQPEERAEKDGVLSGKPRRERLPHAQPLPCHHTAHTLRPPAHLSAVITHTHQSAFSSSSVRCSTPDATARFRNCTRTGVAGRAGTPMSRRGVVDSLRVAFSRKLCLEMLPPPVALQAILSRIFMAGGPTRWCRMLPWC